MKHKHYRRNTEEAIEELNTLSNNTPAHEILGLNKNEKEVLKKKNKQKPEEEGSVKYKKSHHDDFHQALSRASAINPHISSNVNIYHPHEYAKMKTFLSNDKKSGYAIKAGGELVSVFSSEKRRGDGLVWNAKANGAKKLDAFDGYLSDFYKKHGFKEHKREKNWNEGGPDVVYMHMPRPKEQDTVRETLNYLKQQSKPFARKNKTDQEKFHKLMFPNTANSRIYSIPNKENLKNRPTAQLEGQVPNTANVYGSHYPVARILNDNKTLVLHTSDYGTDGKTQELVSKIKKEIPSIFPDFKVLELHHPDYKHSAKAMRIKSEKNLADYFKTASENHPDEEYRKHALDAHLHLTKLKKAEYGKPIHQKRIEHEGWDGKQNEEKRVGRISEYLQRVGLTPDLQSDEGRAMGATFPSSVGINPEGDPQDQQLIHEAGHAMLTPVGQSLPEYQAFIGNPGPQAKIRASSYKKEMQDIHGGGMPEQTAQHMEAGIARRSGVEPFRSPKRGADPQSAEEKARRHAHKTLGLLDEGIHTIDPFTGEKQHGDTVDALINARARGGKGLIKPVEEKVRTRLKGQNKNDFNAKDFLAASEKDFTKGYGISTPIKKAFTDMMKALTAGSGMGAPSTLTGGEALQKEDLGGQILNPHPRKYYEDKRKEEKRKKIGEVNRKKTGAKKPLDAALEKLNIKKGERGDWKKEGYKLEHTTPEDHGSYSKFSVHAISPQGDKIGKYDFFHSHEQDYGGVLQSNTHIEHQRKGLANSAYRLAEKISGKKLIPQDDFGAQTSDAEKLWSQPNRPFGKSEFDESWFFEDDDELTKSAPPEDEGVPHPEKPWVSKRHSNGRMMWHSSPEQASRIDSQIKSKQSHAKILNSLKEPHKSTYIDHIRDVIKDPNRHFVPTEEGGQQKLRARHVKALLDGKSAISLDTSDPNHLTFNRESHSRGVNQGKPIQIKIPTNRSKK